MLFLQEEKQGREKEKVTLDKEGIRESAVSLLSLHSDPISDPQLNCCAMLGNSTQPRLSFLIHKMEKAPQELRRT